MSNMIERRPWQWFRNRVLPWFGLATALFLLGLAIYFAWPRGQRVESLTLTAGSLAGTRATIAEMLVKTAATHELEIAPVESIGSRDALRKVNLGKIELALVQGGLNADAYPNVRRVATLHVEPLHLLVRNGLFNEIDAHVSKLRGKTINFSVEGSGTHELATELLRFLHFDAADFVETNYSYEQLTDPDFEDLPDAVFTVSSLPSPVAQYLIEQHGYRLIALPFAESFQLHWFETPKKSSVNRRRVTASRIPSYAYQVDPPRPKDLIETFGTRLELVANLSVDEDAVDHLCDVIYASDFSKVSGEILQPELLRADSTFGLHDGSREYIERLQPVSTGRVIEVTEQLVGIIGAALGGLLFLWQWMKRTREVRRDREFVGCVERVVEIENRALQYEQDGEMTVGDLEQMQNELGEIKTELIQRYQQGYLEGADMLSAFLKHANDASELISRIVLHETKPRTHFKTR